MFCHASITYEKLVDSKYGHYLDNKQNIPGLPYVIHNEGKIA